MINGNITIKDAIEKASFILSKIEDSRNEAILLIGDVLGLEKAQIFSRFDYEINLKDYEEFIKKCELRNSGIPFQYITGHTEFMSLMFHVNENVLIPRPETEFLVEIGLKYLREINEVSPRVLDLCTGSGCIGISVAKYFSGASIVSTDISLDAIEVARKNSIENGVESQIEFVQSNMFDKIEGKFDLIISNPPYIPSRDIPNLQIEVQNEPLIALDGGKDGFDYYKIIADCGWDYLKHGGLIALELGINQGTTVLDIFSFYHSNEYSFQIGKDYSGIERNLSIIKNCIQ
ncbi:MAG: peptide chain release factor N(5)-glutamine methyltransferase [Bacillota bacterium]